eukprot:gene10333-10399_t
MRRVGDDVVMASYRKLAAHEITEKSAGEIVTRVDREAEARLHDGLSALRTGARVIGEEACAASPALLDRVGEGLVWLVDPLDGTANYAAGHGPFGIMVALVADGRPLAAWMLDPATGRLCRAARGGGAWIDGWQVRCPAAAPQDMVAALATRFMSPTDRKRLHDYADRAFVREPIPRCAAESYPRLVLGRNDVALFQRILPWDHAAGVLFLEEAGGCATHWDGEPYRVGWLGAGPGDLCARARYDHDARAGAGGCGMTARACLSGIIGGALVLSGVHPALAQLAMPVGGPAGQTLPSGPAAAATVQQAVPAAVFAPAVLEQPAADPREAIPAHDPPHPAMPGPDPSLPPPGEFEAYASTMAGEPLRRFGADLLLPGARDFAAPPVAAVPDDYRLNPGDQLVLNLSGAVLANALRLTIDSAGRIFVPRVGAITVGGLRHRDVHDAIARAVSRQFRSFDLDVAVGRLHALTIYVTGYARHPGAYTVSSLSTLVNAVLAAGGPASGGSFRSIQLRRGGRLMSDFDLYDLLLRGDTTGDAVLQNGDVIRIAPAGPQAAVIGSVNHAAIYEMAPGETVLDAVRYAGGVNTVADDSRLFVFGALGGSSGWQQIDAAAARSRKVERGDLVRVVSSAGIARPIGQQPVLVTIGGEVAHPGRYYAAPGTRLGAIVALAGGLTPAAFPYASVISRDSVRAQQRESFARALGDMEMLLRTQPLISANRAQLTGSGNSALIDAVVKTMRDREPSGRLVFDLPVTADRLPDDLIVENNDRIDIPARPVTIGVFGAVPSPASFAYRAGMTIGDAVQMAGGVERLADRKGVFVVRANGTVLALRKDTFRQAALPGDLVFIPVDAARGEFWARLRDVTGSLFGTLIGAASVVAEPRLRRRAYALLAIVLALLSLEPQPFVARAKIVPQDGNSIGLGSMMNALGSQFQGFAALLGGARQPIDLYLAVARGYEVTTLVIQRLGLQDGGHYGSDHAARRALDRAVDVHSLTGGVIEIEVREHDPAAALALTQAYVAAITTRLNTLGLDRIDRKRAVVQARFREAGTRVTQAEAALRAFRLGHNLAEPEAQLGAELSLRAGLQAQLQARIVQLSTLERFQSAANPQIQSMQSEIAALRSQIARSVAPENGAAGPNMAGLSEVSGRYFDLYRDYRFAQALYDVYARASEEVAVEALAAEGAADAQIIEHPRLDIDRKVNIGPLALLVLVLLAAGFTEFYAPATGFFRKPDSRKDEAVIVTSHARAFHVPELSVVIPCFNEVDNVAAIVAAVTREAIQHTDSHEIILIDNFSTDGTRAVIRAICLADARVKAIFNNRNYGQIRSPTHGIFQARGRAVIGMCADFQDPPALIGTFLGHWRAGSLVVLGQRRSERTTPLLGLLRKLGYGVLRRVADHPVIPNATGFGLYDRTVVDTLMDWNEPEPFFRGMVGESGFAITLVPFDRPERAAGSSKNNLASLFGFALSGLASSARTLLRVPILIGLGMAPLTIVLAIGAIVGALLGWAPVWPLAFAALLSMMFGNVMLFLGLIGDQVRLLNERSRGLPLVIEECRINFADRVGAHDFGWTLHWFLTFGYLPQPFVFDTNDTFMDWFNTAFWAHRPGAYAVWHSIYPPLSFVFLRVVGLPGCYVGSPFAARDCDWLGQGMIFACYALDVALVAVALWRSDPRTALPRAVAFAFGLPLLFTLERGNLILPCLACFVVAHGPVTRSRGWRAVASALTINFKPYLLLPVLAHAWRREWRALELAGLATVALYFATLALVGAGTPGELLGNMAGWISFVGEQVWAEVNYSTSYAPLLMVSKAQVPLLEFLPSRRLETILWVVPLVIRSTQIVAAACLIAAWFRTGVLARSRIAVLLLGTCFVTQSPGGYTQTFLLFLVLLEPWRGIGPRVAVICAYLLCLVADWPLATVAHVHANSWLSQQPVEPDFGLTFGHFVRPGLVAAIVWALAIDGLAQIVRAGPGPCPWACSGMIGADDLALMDRALAPHWPRLAGARILFTGATGFIGRWMLEALLRAPVACEVLVISRDPAGYATRAPHLAARFPAVAGNVLDRVCLSAGRFSHVIHGATDASAHLTAHNPRLMFDTIVNGTRHVVDHAQQCGARLVLMSSGAVYGRQPEGINGLDETWPRAPDPRDPAAAYGEGKRAAETLVAIAARQHGLDTVTARIFALMGPMLVLDTHFAAGNFIRDALNGGPVVVNGSGQAVRSYLYAADLAVWMWVLAIAAAPGTTYNIGSEQAVSIADLAQRVGCILGGVPVEIRGRPDPGWNPGRYVPSTAKIRADLGLHCAHGPIAWLDPMTRPEKTRKLAEWLADWLASRGIADVFMLTGGGAMHLNHLGDQELDIEPLVRPITKYAAMVTDPRLIRYHCEKALYLAISGRPGPVWIDIPLDVQAARIDPDDLPGFDPAECDEPWRDTDLAASAQAILARLEQAERPVILIGSGVRLSGAHACFLRVAERLGVPVVTGWNAHDALWNDHPLYAGRPGTVGDRGGNMVTQSADVLLILGSRLNIRQVSYNWKSFARAAFKVWVDIDPVELAKPTVRPDLPIVADLGALLPVIEQALAGGAYAGPTLAHHAWLAWARERVARFPVVLPDHHDHGPLCHPYAAMDRLFDALNADDIVVTGNGSACVTQRKFFNGVEVGGGPKSQVTFPDFGKVAAAFGFAYARAGGPHDLPAAIAATLATPGAALCEIMIDDAVPFAPKLGAKAHPDGRITSPPLEDLSPFLPRMMPLVPRRRPLRFAAAGAINTAFGLSIYPLLLVTVPLFHRHYLLALLAAQAVSLCFAFATYKLGVFRSRGNVLREFGAFAGFYLTTYIANWIVLPLLVEGARVPPVPAQIAFTVLLIGLSWYWHHAITFRGL